MNKYHINKKIISVVSAAVIAVSSIASYASETDEAETVKPYKVPKGCMEQVSVKEVYTDELYHMMTVQETTDGNTELSGFYRYGINSDYGRRYLAETENSEEKLKLYDDILEACREISNSDEDIAYDEEYQMYKYSEIFSDLDQYEISTVYFTFRNDHPEFYWLPNSLQLKLYSDKKISACICVYDEFAAAESRKNTDEKINENIEKVIQEAEICDTDYDKIKSVHDALCNLINYGYIKDENGMDTDIPLDTPEAHSIVSMFDGDETTDGVCESYAKSFQLVLNALDIDNIFVTGYAYGDHAWNMAMIDGNYYYFDLTWDDVDTGIRYNYFAGGERAFNDHTPNTPYPDESVVQNFLYPLPTVGEYGYTKPYNAEFTFALKDLIGKYTEDDLASSLAGMMLKITKDDETLDYGDDFVMYDGDGNTIDQNMFNTYFSLRSDSFISNPSEDMINTINSWSMGVKYGTTMKFTPVYKAEDGYKIYGKVYTEFTAENNPQTPEPTTTPTTEPAPTSTPAVNDPVLAKDAVIELDTETNIMTITVAEGKAESLFTSLAVYDSDGRLSGIGIVELKDGVNKFELPENVSKVFVWDNMKPVDMWERK